MKLNELKWKLYKHSLDFKFTANTSKTSLRNHLITVIEARHALEEGTRKSHSNNLWKWPEKKLNFIASSKNIPYGKYMLGAHGEWSPISHLSRDFCHPDSEKFRFLLYDSIEKLKKHELPSTTLACLSLANTVSNPVKTPSLCFALETLLLDLYFGSKKQVFQSDFSVDKSIRINGLVWIDHLDMMSRNISELLEKKYKCIKIKIGVHSIEEEIRLIKEVRRYEKTGAVEIRLDANGAFDYQTAREVMKMLKPFNIHSVEQPISAGQLANMKKLVSTSPIPIALDEELISASTKRMKANLIKYIRPKYIVLKPQLLGGFLITQEIITLANSLGIQWWLTSALESNIGLNAIAQFCDSLKKRQRVRLTQGLGTGQIYDNNFVSPLKIVDGNLFF